MRKIFMSFLTGISLFFLTFFGVNKVLASSIGELFNDSSNTSTNICTNGECTFDGGIDAVKERVEGIEKEKSFDKYIQDIVTYLLGFLYLLAVVMIIYAGYLLLLSAGTGPEAMGHAKNNIVVVIAGIVIIFLADSIVNFIITGLSQ